MIEHERECSSSKRVHDFEQHLSSKRTKDAQSNSPEQDGSSTTDNESKYSTSDNEESTLDQTDDDSDADDSEDHPDLSTDQSRYTSAVYSQTTVQQGSRPLSRYSSKLIKQFRYVYERSCRKTIDATQCANENLNQKRTCRWQLSNTFNRTDLLNTGYAVLSDERFPFHSLCFMCGSMGHDLLYCNSCCQAYHSACLNELERPHFYPTPDSWVCPNCTICNICGLSMNSPIISCFECRRRFHVQCLKQSKDEQHNPATSNLMWLCPLCIKCDCGQTLVSTERNLVSLNKSLTSQQSLMCTECLKNIKIIRSNKNEDIERCHLCAKFIEQFSTKPKPLFSVSLIGNQSQEKVSNLLQCTRCKHRFHPKCDGYLNEDVTLIPYVKTVCATMICSKCDGSESDKMKTALMNYKLQTVKSTTASVISTLQIMISEESRLNAMKRYLSNLQQLHQSRNRSLNLHAFLNDLLIVVQRLLDNLDCRQWQAAINNCLTPHCPWFKTSNASSSNRTLLCSSAHPSTSHPNVVPSRCLVSPFADHTYALNNDRLFSQANADKTNLLTSTDSLLRYIDNKLDEKDTFDNLYQIDTRICQLCQTYAEYYSTTVSRLIPVGVNQWVHIGCLLPAYTKTLENPPYILHRVREMVNRCQTKRKCERCSQMGASVHCYEENCHMYYHCQCIEEYYLKFDRSLQQKWGMINGLLPNLTTLCVKHSTVKSKNELDGMDDAINLSKLKPLHLSSTIHADLSNSVVDFSPTNIQLCIGSLQIHSFGDFQYLLDNDRSLMVYPNGYHASRLFWSTKHARRKTVYHLRITIEQTYHQVGSNHRTIEYPLSNEQVHMEQLYETCEQYFSQFHTEVPPPKFNRLASDHAQYTRQPRSSLIKCSISKSAANNITRPRDRVPNGNTVKSSETIAIDTKTLRNFVTSGSTNLSRLAMVLAQALQHADQPLPSTDVKEHGPIFSYYLSDQKHESFLGQNIEVLLDQLAAKTKSSESVDDASSSSHKQSNSVTNSSTLRSETLMPQVDGNVDHCDDDRRSTPTSTSNEKSYPSGSSSPSHLSADRRRSTSSGELVGHYQQWLASKFGRVKFTITSDDGYDITSDDLDNAWSRIVSLVRACRNDMHLTHLPMSNEELNGHQIFGLTKPIVKTILNQIYQRSLSIADENTPPIILPLSSSSKHKNATDFIKRKLNRSKSNRLHSRMNSYQRKMSQRQRFNWLSNPNRKPEYALNSFAIDDALAYARRVLLEESSVRLRLYHLRYFSERALIVGSSAIHGCGLFTLMDLVEGQMVTEYTGEVIRPCLTDQREHENERKGFGCYMFTVDSMNVIDATHQGNKARFINHNCQPNCFAKTVQSGETKHIVIYALRDISRGSELTYDYSFPEEDVKIPCHCGTNKCRNYLN